jgi:hypothetical protein
MTSERDRAHRRSWQHRRNAQMYAQWDAEHAERWARFVADAALHVELYDSDFLDTRKTVHYATVEDARRAVAKLDELLPQLEREARQPLVESYFTRRYRHAQQNRTALVAAIESVQDSSR